MFQWWSETSYLLSSLLLGGDKHVGGHNFKTYSFPTARWCDVCGRFLWGLVRQGMKCKSKLVRGEMGEVERGRRGEKGRREERGRREGEERGGMRKKPHK